jgi:hypothetical protein
VQLQNIGNVALRGVEAMLNAAVPQQFTCQGADQGLQISDLLSCNVTYTASQEEIERGVISSNISVSAVTGPVNASRPYKSTLQLPAMTITAVRSMVLRVYPGFCNQPIQSRKYLAVM